MPNWNIDEQYWYVELYNEGYGVTSSIICDNSLRNHPNRFKNEEDAKECLNRFLEEAEGRNVSSRIKLIASIAAFVFLGLLIYIAWRI